MAVFVGHCFGILPCLFILYVRKVLKLFYSVETPTTLYYDFVVLEKTNSRLYTVPPLYTRNSIEALLSKELN